jgi:hypothetical protein
MSKALDYIKAALQIAFSLVVLCHHSVEFPRSSPCSAEISRAGGVCERDQRLAFGQLTYVSRCAI